MHTLHIFTLFCAKTIFQNHVGQTSHLDGGWLTAELVYACMCPCVCMVPSDAQRVATSLMWHTGLVTVSCLTVSAYTVCVAYVKGWGGVCVRMLPSSTDSSSASTGSSPNLSGMPQQKSFSRLILWRCCYIRSCGSEWQGGWECDRVICGVNLGLKLKLLSRQGETPYLASGAPWGPRGKWMSTLD